MLASSAALPARGHPEAKVGDTGDTAPDRGSGGDSGTDSADGGKTGSTDTGDASVDGRKNHWNHQLGEVGCAESRSPDPGGVNRAGLPR